MALTSLDQGYAAVTAAGSSITDAVLMTNDVNVVTCSATTKGVTLPTVAPGKVVIVKGDGTNNAHLYVTNGGTLDGTAGATGGTLTAAKTGMYVCSGYVTGTVGQASAFVTLASALA
jgi:hypothetical protein